MTTETSSFATANKDAKYHATGDVTVSGSMVSALTQSAGIIFRILPLPKAAVISDLTVAGGSGECTMDWGVTEDDNILIAAASASAAAPPEGINVIGGVGYTTTTATYLIATMDAVSSAATGGTYRFSVTYHMD